jgi:hypothetical protein
MEGDGMWVDIWPAAADIVRALEAAIVDRP